MLTNCEFAIHTVELPMHGEWKCNASKILSNVVASYLHEADIAHVNRFLDRRRDVNREVQALVPRLQRKRVRVANQKSQKFRSNQSQKAQIDVQQKRTNVQIDVA